MRQEATAEPEAESTKSWLDMLESTHNPLSLGELVARATERAFPAVPATEPSGAAQERADPIASTAAALKAATPPPAEPKPATPPVTTATVDMAAKPDTPPATIRVRVPAPAMRATVSPFLIATFISDNNVPDGHVFPPGAEFTKSWLLANEGDETWPADTELAFVSGSRLGAHGDVPNAYHVGAVVPGARVDVSAADMKAPDAAGRYIGYWRLRDGTGTFFGHRMWCDIIVVEPEHDSSSSLASSAVVMPRSAPSVASARASVHGTQAPTEFVTAEASVPQTPATLTAASDDGFSDVDTESSGSLVDLDSDGEDMWRARVQVAAAAGAAEPDEYVVLYDSASTSADEEVEV